MLDVFLQAIRTKQLVQFEYDGFVRTVEPHAVGVSSKGNEVVLCFQVAGGHRTPGHDWDLCILSKVHALRLTGLSFPGPRDGYKRNDSHMVTIYTQL